MNNEEANPTENQNLSSSQSSANLLSEQQSQTPSPSPPSDSIPINQNSTSQSEPKPQSDQTSTQPNVTKKSAGSTAVASSGFSDEEKKRRQLVLLEAALYVAGRPLGLNEIGSVINSRSKKRAYQLVKELQKIFTSRTTALEILELRDERYVLQLKAEFTPLVKKLVNRPLLSPGPLKTLSYIAYRQPVSQKRVIEVRGQHAYGHIKLLKDMDLVVSERNGRSLLLRTSDYFADYFGLPQDVTIMKRDLKRIFGDFPQKAPSQSTRRQQQNDEQS